VPQGEYLQYGGQAVIEGVMMRSPNFFAVACRAPNGEIVVQTESVEKTWIGRQKWLKLPLLRGSLALLDTIALGIKAMRFATNVQVDPSKQPGDAVVKEVTKKEKRIQDAAVGGTMVVSLGFGIFIFQLLPNLIAQPLEQLNVGSTGINLVTEIIKVVFFLGYIWGIGHLPDIKEVFKYHGAEHKAINALEANEPQTLESVGRQTRLHPRCGTSFAIVVLMVSFVIFTFVPRYPLGQHFGVVGNAFIRFLLELCILPLISGIAYEIIRAAGKFRHTTIVNTLLYPGLMSQYLTTREPEDKHLEVAIRSLDAVLVAEAEAEAARNAA
jgi:uncharacterized protein YqhQ